MSEGNIYIQTLLDALATPSTLAALSRKTGYPLELIFQLIIKARREGYTIAARSREGERTYYERITDGNNPDA